MSGAVDAAARALARGELVILPTETVYGLAADAGNPDAVARVFAAKGRSRFNPLIAHVHDLEAADRVAALTEVGRRLAAAFWPGPLTLVARPRAGAGVCELARAGLDSVAVRVPAHPVALALLARFGHPVAAPSANRSGRPSPTRLADALEETGDSAAKALEGGPCAVGVESTVVSLLGARPAILRPGGLASGQIADVAGPLDPSPQEAHRSPGRLSAHYAPDAPVRLNAQAPREGEAYLGFGEAAADGPRMFSLSPDGDVREAAANLYRLLREADRTRPVAIAVAPVPAQGLGEAINDRLRRAAGFTG